MAVIVHRIAVVADEVVPVDVVDESVAIVVDSVAGHLSRIRPDVCGQVGMAVIHTRIDHGHYDAGGAGGEVPRLRGIDICIDGATRLARVLEAPQIEKPRIVREHRGVQERIRLIVRNTRVAAQPSIDGGEVQAGFRFKQHHPLEAQSTDDLRLERNSGQQVHRAGYGPGLLSGFRGQLNHPPIASGVERFIQPVHWPDCGLTLKQREGRLSVGLSGRRQLFKPGDVDGGSARDGWLVVPGTGDAQQSPLLQQLQSASARLDP